MSIKLVMPSNHLILCRSLLLLPLIFPSIRVFSNETFLCVRWPKYWSLSFNIIPSNEYSGLMTLRIDWFDLLAVQGALKSLLQHHNSQHQFFGTRPSLWSNSHICTCMHARFCLTLCDSMDCSPPGTSVHGIFQARILEWVSIAYSKGLVAFLIEISIICPLMPSPRSYCLGVSLTLDVGYLLSATPAPTAASHCVQVRKQQLELDMEQQTGSK